MTPSWCRFSDSWESTTNMSTISQCQKRKKKRPYGKLRVPTLASSDIYTLKHRSISPKTPWSSIKAVTNGSQIGYLLQPSSQWEQSPVFAGPGLSPASNAILSSGIFQMAPGAPFPGSGFHWVGWFICLFVFLSPFSTPTGTANAESTDYSDSDLDLIREASRESLKKRSSSYSNPTDQSEENQGQSPELSFPTRIGCT